MSSSLVHPIIESERHEADSCSAGREAKSQDPGTFHLPELLAPAGDWECAKAAVENGADALYFGLEKFNARMRAQNFTVADLPKLMGFLHRRGVKGYVAFNTLVFENELEQVEHFARAFIAAGVDAAIVQDVGICRLLRQLSPDFPIHVSTQMTITSAAGIEFARELGCNLVVLARECSLAEIEKIQSAQKHSPEGEFASALPLEVFVHGALCVAYSGQCLTSEALGGRSANRGECAQACRMAYDLISDGRLVPLGDRKYLLSPQDLAGLEVLPELAKLGVASLKIEGRLKSPQYVANITRIYRQALDALWVSSASNPGDCHARSSMDPQASTFSPQAARYEMEMAFSRGLHTGWFGGVDNQRLIHARFGKKRGVYLGQVTAVLRGAVLVHLEGPLKQGDGVVFDAGKPEQKEEGGRVYEIKQKNGADCSSTPRQQKKNGATGMQALLRFGEGDIDFGRLHVGDRLWKTSDPELERRLQRSFEGEEPRFQRSISIEVHGTTGRPLTVIARDELGNVVRLDSNMPLAPAEKQPLGTNRLREQFGRLGATPFKLGELSSLLEGEVLLPLSELNRLRRQMVADLMKLRARPPCWTLRASPIRQPQPPLAPRPSAECPDALLADSVNLSSADRSERSRSHVNRPAAPPLPVGEGWGERNSVPALGHPGSGPHLAESALGSAHLIVLVRNPAQLEQALTCGIQMIYCDFEDPKKYREAVTRFRNTTSRTSSSALFVAPPRIFKMGEEWILKQVRSCEADGYLVRNYDHLRFFAGQRCVGDYSFNVANHLAADYFKNRLGLERLTASYDLNFAQLEALLQGAPPEWFEVTIHQHMPMFHMEHCVFCAFLSEGTNYTNCGRPCDKHDVKLRDRVGAEHPVKADLGCRNTVFNGLAQTGAEYVSRMLNLGVRHFRLEFLNEAPDQVSRTIEKYRSLLCGQITGAQLWRELKLFNQLGVTRGQIAGSAIRS